MGLKAETGTTASLSSGSADVFESGLAAESGSGSEAACVCGTLISGSFAEVAIASFSSSSFSFLDILNNNRYNFSS
ncbi:MAG: hypothetical protein NVV82_21025 [Sporocytophaga sp.]|nr:hypothetical protein [Sporocytophaga sp.]